MAASWTNCPDCPPHYEGLNDANVCGSGVIQGAEEGFVAWVALSQGLPGMQTECLSDTPTDPDTCTSEWGSVMGLETLGTRKQWGNGKGRACMSCTVDSSKN